MNVLDTSIANVSIPAIAGDLGVSPDQGTWVITSFGVANAISLPLTGWLTQRFGQVRLFTASMLLFVLASFLCALAPSLGLLILFRVIQGAVAGPMIPLSQSLLLSSYPKGTRGHGAGDVVDHDAGRAGRRPAARRMDHRQHLVAVDFLHQHSGRHRRRRGDLDDLPHARNADGASCRSTASGSACSCIWVGALQIMLDRARISTGSSRLRSRSLAIVAVVGFALFLVWELTERHPVVDLRLFARRNFWTSTVAMSLAYGTFFGNLVLLPLWLQQYMGYTATMAGMVLAPVGLLAILLTPLVGRNITKVDPRVFATASFAIFAVVLFMRSQFNTDADFRTLMMPTITAGRGDGGVLHSAGHAQPVRALARPDSRGIGTVQLRADHRRIVRHVDRHDDVGPRARACITRSSPSTSRRSTPTRCRRWTTCRPAASASSRATQMLNRLIDQQAFMLSANDIFYVSALLFLVLIGVVWLARPVRSAAGNAAATAAGD